jgi:hypothetical protein
MNDLLRLIRRRILARKSKSFPRRVTAPNGSHRWQAPNGLTFDTLEDATNA